MTLLPLLFVLASSARIASPSITPNDNLTATGRLEAGMLTVKLVADMGVWRPDGPQGRALDVAAFAEEGAAPTVPGPLIRAVEGTSVVVTLRNALASELRVFGLCARAPACDAVTVPAGSSREIRFALTAPGTYYYWGSTAARSLTARPRVDSQLNGIIVVDPRKDATRDRILVVTLFGTPRPIGLCGGNVGADAVFAVNGVSWPHTARLRYDTNETVRWRVINLSCDQHAMHLHGFHFTVDAVGDGIVDRQYAPAERRTAVTEVMPPGRTFAMSWTPTRAGNWLFHCHMVEHMSPLSDGSHARHDTVSDAGMAGLVVGIEVGDPAGATAKGSAPASAARQLSLVLTQDANRYGHKPGYRAEIAGADAPRVDAGPVPGPILVLTRGEPVEITVVNRMNEPTAIHWHGIEIESYFDGVPGFGGRMGQIAPPVEPGRSFVAKMTPPRAGTFIYHTHWHDDAQLAGGLYGPLLVLEPGERYDPATDHVVVIGLNGVLVDDEREPFALNGRANPAPIVMRAGVPNRLRLINITPNNVALTAFLVDQFEVVRWKPVAKDGASLSPPQSEPRVARQMIGVGETYDFEIDGGQPRNLWLEVRRGNGEWVLQAPIVIR